MPQRVGLPLILCAILWFLRIWVTAQQQQQQPQPSQLLSQQWMDADHSLRVTLRHTQLHQAKACQHAFAQVEMHNVHPTENTIVYTVSASAEETSWTDATTGQRHYWGSHRVVFDEENHAKEPGHRPGGVSMTGEVAIQEDGTLLESRNGRNTMASVASPSSSSPDADWLGADDQQEYRRQIYVSHLPGNSLTLGPDQVAILPLSFFPRFPVEHEEWYPHHSQARPPRVASTTTPPSPSQEPAYARADWADWKGQTASSGESYYNSSNDDYSWRLSPQNNRHAVFFNPEQQQQHRVSSSSPSSYQIRTLLTIESSRGIIRIPIFATSRLENSYGLPSRIVLRTERRESITHAPNGTAKSDRRSSSSTTTTTAASAEATENVKIISRAQPFSQPARRRPGTHLDDDDNNNNDDDDEHVTDCFDIYMKHPGGGDANAAAAATTDVQILQVLVTMPDVVHVQRLEDESYLLDKSSSKKESSSTSATPRQVIQSFTNAQGPLPLPVDGRGQYVATVCASTQGVPATTNVWDDATRNGEQGLPADLQHEQEPYSLGYLQIRTTTDTLWVALERPLRTKNATNDAAKDNTSAKEERGGRTKDSPVDFFESFLHVNRSTTTATPLKQKQAEAKSNNTSFFNPADILEASPNRLEHLFLSSASLQSMNRTSSSEQWTVRLTNVGRRHQDVQVVRAAVGIPTDEFDANGIDIAVHSMNRNLSLPLSSGSSVPDAFTLECKIDWDKLVGYRQSKSLTIRGAVIVRAFLLDQDSSAEDTSAIGEDGSFVVLIPFTLRIMGGSIGVVLDKSTYPSPVLVHTEEWTDDHRVISSLFFPQTQLAAQALLQADTRVDLVTEKSTTLQHDLRVISDMATDLKVHDAVILDENHTRGGPLCSRFRVTFPEEQPGHQKDLGDGVLGRMRLHYRWGEHQSTADRHQVIPTSTLCFLRFTTLPETGQHLIPLVVFPGQVDVSESMFRSATDSSSLADRSAKQNGTSSWHDITVGFGSFFDWCQTTKGGSSLLSMLSSRDSSSGTNTFASRDQSLLGQYLYSLSQEQKDGKNSRLVPVLLKVDAIAHGEVESWPLYLTNHNPVPITISMDVSEVEGMSISLGRDECSGYGSGNSALDYLQPPEVAEPKIEAGRFAGHPINGLREFLLKGGLAQTYLDLFSFRDSVSLSDWAVARLPVLKRLFGIYSRGTFHRSAVPAQHRNRHCNDKSYPASYGEFERRVSRKGITGAMMVSTDGKKARRLKVCSDSSGLKRDDSGIVLPPGGVVRFDVRLRAPPNSILDNDITGFVSGGLVLSTNYGEVIPIFISFEALQGQLELSHLPSTSIIEYRDDIIRVPAGLFGNLPSSNEISLQSVYIPPKGGALSQVTSGVQIVSRNSTSSDSDEIPLFIRSSFSRDIYLRKISSCNPWFSISSLGNTIGEQSDPFLGVNVGSVSSTVACEAETGSHSTPFPSFFRCALNWLTRRTELQPKGCGLLPTREERRGSRVGQYAAAELGGVDQAIATIRNALDIFEQKNFESAEVDSGRFRFLKSGQRRGGGIVAPSVLKAAVETWKAWQVVSDLGLRKIGTSLRAIVEYNSSLDEKTLINLKSATHAAEQESRLLSVAISNVTVESLLEMPRLCDTEKDKHILPDAFLHEDEMPSVLSFPPTLVGGVTVMNIPISNPTGVAVRVRLAVAPSRAERVHSSQDAASEEVLSPRYFGNLEPPFVQCGAPRKFGPMDDGNHHWWGPSDTFFHPDMHGDIIRSHQNVTIKAGLGAQFSLISPSVMFNTAFLVGCGARCGVRRDEGNSNKKTPFVPGLVDLTPTSPIGASAVAGSTLLGRTNARVSQEEELVEGFHAGGSLMSGARGPSAFAIPFSALDEVVIPPFGRTELGPVLFRPPGRAEKMGCGAFEGSKRPDHCESQSFHAMLLLENSLSGIERVVLHGKALWESIVLVDPMNDQEEAFGSIELRNGESTLVFSGSADVSTGASRPVQKEAVLHNAGDTVIEISGVSLSRSGDASRDSRNRCRSGDFALIHCDPAKTNSFYLAPGENRTLYLQHTPRCTKRKDFVRLRVDLRGASGLDGLNDSAHREKSRYQGFRRTSIQMAVGYEMNGGDFQSCKPTWRSEDRGDSTSRFKKKMHMGSANGSLWAVFAPVFACVKFGLVVFWGIFVATLLVVRWKCATQFMFFLETAPSDDLAPGDKFLSLQMGRTWSAAFRCLARVDPALTDLQTLGREQTRQIVLLRYRMFEATPPQYFTSAVMMHRERSSAVAGSTRRQTSGRSGTSSGPERMKTLSDGLLGNCIQPDGYALGQFPCLVGWRVAASRGIITRASMDSCPLEFETKEYSEDRSSHSLTIADIGDASSSTHDDGVDSDTFHVSSGDLDNSHDISEEHEEENSAETRVGGQASGIKESSNMVKQARGGKHREPNQQPNHPNAQIVEGSRGFVTVTVTPEPAKSARTGRLHRKPNGRRKAADEEGTKHQNEQKKDHFIKNSRSTKQKTPSSEAGGQKTKAPKVVDLSKDGRKKFESSQDRKKKKNVGLEQPKKGRTNKNEGMGEHRMQGKGSAPPKNPWKAKTRAASKPISLKDQEGLRPPPGLAPPPGFGEPTIVPKDKARPTGDQGKFSSTLGGTELPSLDYATLERTVSESSLASGENIQPSQPSSPVARYRPPSPVSPVIPSGNEGFDVMAFLDDILNEGSASVDEGGVLTEASATEDSYQNTQAFSSNPWATSTDINQSRAAAYGISIEDESNREPEPVDLPLLTPQAILSASIAHEKDEEDKKTIDFYADLLGD